MVCCLFTLQWAFISCESAAFATLAALSGLAIFNLLFQSTGDFKIILILLIGLHSFTILEQQVVTESFDLLGKDLGLMGMTLTSKWNLTLPE